MLVVLLGLTCSFILVSIFGFLGVWSVRHLQGSDVKFTTHKPVDIKLSKGAKRTIYMSRGETEAWFELNPSDFACTVTGPNGGLITLDTGDLPSREFRDGEHWAVAAFQTTQSGTHSVLHN